MFLVLASVASISVLPVLAAPVDKIMSDQEFLAVFDPNHAIILPYADGEKTAVAIPSNAHYANYASEGFWFYWDANQKDSGYAVLSRKFFTHNESLILTVKSSNEYKNVTITQPGTYFIDRFLLKNEKKGPEGGYHNINWIGFKIVEKNLEMELNATGHWVSPLYPGAPFLVFAHFTNLGSMSTCAEITSWGLARFIDHNGDLFPEPIPLPILNDAWTASFAPVTDNSFIVYNQASAEAYLDYYWGIPETYRDRIPPPIMYGKIPAIPELNEIERIFLFYPGIEDYYIFDDSAGDTSSDGYVLRHFDSFSVDLEFYGDISGAIGDEWNDLQEVELEFVSSWNAIGSTSFKFFESADFSEQLFDAMIFFGDSFEENPLYSIQWFLDNLYFL